MTPRKTGWLASVRRNAVVLGGTAAAFWALEVADTLIFWGGLDGYGVRPRTLDGLWGILYAPFLHGGFGHLAMNTVPFLLLGALTMTRRPLDFWVVSVVGALTSGIGTWLVGGAGTVHIGASGVIFAYLGFLMARGWFERRMGAIALSAVVTWAFGSMIWGVFPTVGAGISWEGHLFGFLGGVLVARVLGGAIRKRSGG